LKNWKAFIRELKLEPNTTEDPDVVGFDFVKTIPRYISDSPAKNATPNELVSSVGPGKPELHQLVVKLIRCPKKV
jgi:hypothetical protein